MTKSPFHLVTRELPMLNGSFWRADEATVEADWGRIEADCGREKAGFVEADCGLEKADFVDAEWGRENAACSIASSLNEPPPSPHVLPAVGYEYLKKHVFHWVETPYLSLRGRVSGKG